MWACDKNIDKTSTCTQKSQVLQRATRWRKHDKTNKRCNK